MNRLTPILLLLCSCGDAQPPPTPPPAPPSPSGGTGLIRAAEGGTVGQPGSAMIEFPAGSLKEDATVEIRKEDSRAFEGAASRVVGPAWSVRINGKDHYEFSIPPVVHLPYDAASLPPGWPVDISHWTGDGWTSSGSAEIHPLRRTVEARVRHFSVVAPTAPAAEPRILGRWRGSTREIHKFNGAESDRLQWGTTGHTDIKEFSWSCREEYSDYLRQTRLINEGASWSVSLGASYHSEGVTGDRQLPRFEAVQAGGSWGAKELNRYLDEQEQATLATKQSELAALRGQLAALQIEYDAVPPPREYATEQERVLAQMQEETRKIEVEGRASLVLMTLRDIEREVQQLQFKSSLEIVTPSVSRQTNARSGEPTIAIRAFISSDPRHTGFTRNVWSLSVLTMRGDKIEHKMQKQELSLYLNGQHVEAPPGGPWREVHTRGPDLYGEFKVVSEYFGSGDPGSTMDLTVRGRVIHRVFVPKTDAEANVITSAGGGGDLADRVVPVAGFASIKAWVSQSPSLPETLPDYHQRTGPDGTFALMTNLGKNDILHLALVYANAEARLSESCTMSISGKELLALRDAQSGSAWAVTVPLKRTGKAVVRHGAATKELDLGSDERPAALRKKEDGTFLEFEGRQSLLVGTFCLQSPHFNQNTEQMPIEVDVPVDRLLELCPPTRLDAVRKRLDGAVKDGKTTVTFREYVTCQPSCCTMALWCLGFSAGLAEVAQATYDHRKAGDGKPDAPPWHFPIPTQPEKWTRYKEFMATFDPVEVTPAEAAEWRRMAGTLDSSEFNEWWPYVDADSYTKQEWLADQEDGVYRVWQVPKHFRPALEAKYKPNLATEEDWKDIFSSELTPVVLNRLGAGRPAAVSIAHLSRQKEKGVYVKAKGGHLILLLGAIVDKDGQVLRLLFHDPYGDLTRTPEHEGYHDPAWLTGGAAGAQSDIAKKGHLWG